MRLIFTLFLTLFFSTLYSQKEFSIYFNNVDKIWNTNREINVCQHEEYIIVNKDDIVIEISIIDNKTTIFYEDDFVGQFLTKSFISDNHIVIFFIKSKTYYYIFY